MRPPDYLDWQTLLARRQEPEVRALLERARAEVGPDADPDALALAWVRAARAAGLGLLPGRPWSQAYRVLRWSAVVLGFLLGGGAAQAVLAVPTGEPANVWVFLGILVLPQLLLVVLVQLGTLYASARGRETFGALLLLLRGLHRWLAERLGGSAWSRLPTLRGPPGEVWRWLGLTQRLGLSFSLGALTAFLLTMVFVDVGFAWSSTFADLEVHQVERFVRFVAAPWRSWLPAAVPSPEVVAATHWSQLEGRFLGGGAPGEAARSWWPFLAMCLVTYALLPRLLSLLLTDHRARAAVARHRTLDDPAWRELLAELGAAGPWRRPEGEPAAEAPAPTSSEDRGAGTAQAAPRRPVSGAEPAAAVAWGGIPLDEAHLRHPVLAAHGLHRADLHRAGGREAAEDEAAIRAVGPGPEPLWLLVEAGATPDKRLLRFLERLELETGRPLTVGVLRPDGSELGAVPEQELRLWREVTGRLGRRRPAVVLLGPDGEPLADGRAGEDAQR